MTKSRPYPNALSDPSNLALLLLSLLLAVHGRMLAEETAEDPYLVSTFTALGKYSTDEICRDMRACGVNALVFWPSTFKEEQTDPLKAWVDRMHGHGFKVIAGINPTGPAVCTEARREARRTLYRQVAGLGVDMLFIDEPYYGLTDYHHGKWGDYSDDAKPRFRDYLKRRYGQERLRKDLGVAKLEELGLPTREEAKRNPKLWYEFVRFHSEYLTEFLQSLVAAAREVKPGLPFYVNVSVCGIDAGPRYGPPDYGRVGALKEFQTYGADPYNHIRMSSDYWVAFGTSVAMSGAWPRPVKTYLSTYHGYGNAPLNLYRGTMCAYSYGAMGMGYHRYTHALTLKWKPDYHERWAQIKRALTFMRQHPLVGYRHTTPVALYFPHHTFYIRDFDVPWCKNGGVWGAAYFAERTFYSLLRNHIPTHILFPSMGREKALKERLAAYRVVVLPGASLLSDDETEMLTDWVKAGGLLIATGSPGLYDQYGSRRADLGMAPVFGAGIGESAKRACVRICEKHPLLGDWEVGREIACEGVPKKSYLAIAKAPNMPYRGNPRRPGPVTYKLEGIENLAPVAPSYVPRGCRVLGRWDDGTPAIVLNRCGQGYALLCGAIDLTIGFEFTDWQDSKATYWENPEYLQFLDRAVRWRANVIETDAPRDVETNLLRSEDGLAVALLLHGNHVKALADEVQRTVPACRIRVPLPDKTQPGAAVFVTEESTAKLAFKVKDGRFEAELPPFRDFGLCKIALRAAE